MSKNSNTHEKCTIIDGVILTEKAIDRLKTLQEHDNEGIDYISKIIQKGIRTIVRHLDYSDPEEIQKVQFILTDLAYVCDWIEDLEKP